MQSPTQTNVPLWLALRMGIKCILSSMTSLIVKHLLKYTFKYYLE